MIKILLGGVLGYILLSVINYIFKGSIFPTIGMIFVLLIFIGVQLVIEWNKKR